MSDRCACGRPLDTRAAGLPWCPHCDRAPERPEREYPSSRLPDLEDPATLGCLIFGLLDDEGRVTMEMHALGLVEGPDGLIPAAGGLAEAAVRALEDAP